MPAYPTIASARDRFVLDHRPLRPANDAWARPRVVVEDECAADGGLARVATIFLTGRECPWRCVMCDLWMHTTVGDTPAGAIVAQIAAAREPLASAWPVDVVKLYNAGSFFDPRAVPTSDYPAIAAQLRGVSRVIVESHPSLIGERTMRFVDALQRTSAGGRTPVLEVAMGLETANPDALERLNKRMTIGTFVASASTLRHAGLALRTFLLISPPFVPHDQQDHWLEHSIDLAIDCGASVVSLIPLRAGNGAVDALVASGLARQPAMADIERSAALALGRAAGTPARAFVDLWDLPRFSSCTLCVDRRLARLDRINRTQRDAPAVICHRCSAESA
jgi:radical SAM enzyme (TIGR01210 family)